MYIDILLTLIGLLGLLVGTITDFQKREVADWLNFSLMFSGIGIRLLYSILNLDWQFITFGLIWFALAYLFSLVMFYSGQWGGGDCKMIMGLGALFGTAPFFFNNSWNFFADILPFSVSYNITFMLHFLFNAFVVGAIYGLLWTVILVIIHWKNFSQTFAKKIKEPLTLFTTIAAIIVFIFGYGVLLYVHIFDLLLQIVLWLVLIMPFIFTFIKSVETSAMIKMMKIKDLTEGEWIVDDVIVDKKYICGPKDLGISLEAIKKLKALQKKKKIDAVKVKIGIPFVPAFLIAFIITAFFGNVMLLFL